ncbi:MAG: tetratricopeptide repeat protein, partial [Pseudomonadota bacterium]
MLMGQLKPTAGEVRLEGQRITGLGPRAIWRRGVGRTFQITATYPSMTVVENVQMALMSHYHGLFALAALASRQHRDEAEALLARVGMEAQAERHAAILLTEVGTESGALSAADRAGALLLAGDIWLRLERIDLAEQSYDRALTLSPSDPEAMIGLAKAKARPGDYAAAEALLTRALDVRPLDPQALILRASAHRRLGAPEKALSDSVAALKVNEAAPIAWFEKGAAQRALGDVPGAQESWLTASQLDPVGPVGDMAREGLQGILLGDWGRFVDLQRG